MMTVAAAPSLGPVSIGTPRTLAKASPIIVEFINTLIKQKPTRTKLII